MASKLRQGRDTEISGVEAAQSLQRVIREVLDIKAMRSQVRPEGSFTAKEYAKEIGVAESTAKKAHLYPLVADGTLEVTRMAKPMGGMIYYYRKKTTEIESNRKETHPASNGHALDTNKGRRGK